MYIYTLCGYFLHKYGKNFSSRIAAHATTKYQRNSTSGRGARASYQTRHPTFRFGGRVWSQVSDTCRQRGRERNVGP